MSPPLPPPPHPHSTSRTPFLTPWLHARGQAGLPTQIPVGETPAPLLWLEDWSLVAKEPGETAPPTPTPHTSPQHPASGQKSE